MPKYILKTWKSGYILHLIFCKTKKKNHNVNNTFGIPIIFKPDIFLRAPSRCIKWPSSLMLSHAVISISYKILSDWMMSNMIYPKRLRTYCVCRVTWAHHHSTHLHDLQSSYLSILIDLLVLTCTMVSFSV